LLKYRSVSPNPDPLYSSINFFFLRNCSIPHNSIVGGVGYPESRSITAWFEPIFWVVIPGSSSTHRERDYIMYIDLRILLVSAALGLIPCYVRRQRFNN